MTEKTYRMDTLNGPYRMLYENGKPKIEGSYIDGLFDGKWIYYDDSGNVVGIGIYNRGTGSQKTWHSNGQLKHIINYKDNLKQGKEIWYNPDGTIQKVIKYDEGS